MILKKGNATAQDSNDRFLANIQKGGTYSVVPRIPGGEITPDKLIVIGTVAKKYNLYTKITGGQRIDMFGAHLDDLPEIWEALIAAGFESGHAYGKSLRTVKSCVGSTWCRFGLHDSVSFAISIEERYRGLRSPHKLKGGVSGCIRECAEAQSKDFGIIATEKGWNLFVCGNGGSKPQHALLLAADLDDETCIKYIDRFLMFYIRTADPLTRTATWLNKMEGGIDYLRNVVINDSLQMGAQWEKEMQVLVDSYECEWKAAVENPEIRKRFTHFVNAPEEKDPSVSLSRCAIRKKLATGNNNKGLVISSPHLNKPHRLPSPNDCLPFYLITVRSSALIAAGNYIKDYANIIYPASSIMVCCLPRGRCSREWRRVCEVQRRTDCSISFYTQKRMVRYAERMSAQKADGPEQGHNWHTRQ